MIKNLMTLTALLTLSVNATSNLQESSKESELYYAAKINDQKKVKTLIEQEKISPNYVNPETGHTTIMDADPELIPYLLEHGANPSLMGPTKSRFLVTPFSVLLNDLLTASHNPCERDWSTKIRRENIKTGLVAILKYVSCDQITIAQKNVEALCEACKPLYNQKLLEEIVSDIKEQSGCAQLERNKKDFFYTLKKLAGQYKGQRNK